MRVRRPRLTDTKAVTASTQRRLLVLVLCAPLLGFIGVVAAEAVPDTWIADHIRCRARRHRRPKDPGPTPLGTTAARYTECTALSLGLGDPPGATHVEAALLASTYNGCVRLDAAMKEYDETGELRTGFAYLRYWHGYAVLTRPLLGVIGVAGTRWIAFVLMAIAVGGMCATVRRAFGTVAAALLVAPTVLTTDVVIGSLSASSAIGTGTAWAAGWLSFRVVASRPEWRTALLTATLAGAITAYFDLMTTMPGSFALTVVGATLGACAAGVHPARPGAWRVTGAAAIGWVTGLLWMWASKWILASFAVGLDAVIHSVKGALLFRLSPGSPGVSESRVRGWTVNFSYWWGQPLTPWVVVGTLAILVVVLIRARRSATDLARIALCCGIAGVPVVGWYLALSNHSQIHHLLVYRSIPIAFGAVAALAYVAAISSAPSKATWERSLPETLPEAVH